LLLEALQSPSALTPAYALSLLHLWLDVQSAQLDLLVSYLRAFESLPSQVLIVTLIQGYYGEFATARARYQGVVVMEYATGHQELL
jgi:hypothetical protein